MHLYAVSSTSAHGLPGAFPPLQQGMPLNSRPNYLHRILIIMVNAAREGERPENAPSTL